MAIFPKAVYRFNAVLTKIATAFLCGNRQANMKFIWPWQGTLLWSTVCQFQNKLNSVGCFSPSLSNWNDLSESQLFLCSSCLSLQPYLSAWHITLLCSEDTAFKKKINYRFVVTLCLLVPFSRQPLLALYLCVTFGNSCNIPRFSIVRLFVMVTDEWPLMWPLWLTEGSDDGYHF